ncbi:hypothetical protein, partial [Pseudomonas sp. GM55]|uniref:hypothetical protein n=1 Tax=Pseudomonas sp. GM55 TaxID=1144333 RepID=UPI0005BC3909
DQKPKQKRGGLTADLTTTERRSPVGASLLAKAALSFELILRAPSLASQLLHRIAALVIGSWP